MKKSFLYTLAALVLAAGCAEIQETAPVEPQLPEGMREFIEVSVPETKVALGNEAAGQFAMVWAEGDKVAVLDGNLKSVYELYEGAGTKSARFKYVSGEANPAVITDVIYPASATKEVPVTQTYISGSFDPQAAVLVYHNESGLADDPILLKNQCSYLCFQLTGKDKVKEIKVAVKGGKTYTMTVPQVQLGTEVQPFYMVVPAQENVRTDVVFTSAEGSMTRILASKTFLAGKMHRFAALPYKADKTFRILSYNVAQCAVSPEKKDGDGKVVANELNSSPKFIADILKELKADAAVLNEVLQIKSHPQGIAGAMGWDYFFQPAAKDGLKDVAGEGNQLLYNPSLAPLATSYLELNKNKGKYNRVCAFVEFEDFILAGTHLSKEDFLEHIALVTAEVQKKYKGTDKPVFLCGDMNIRPYSAEMRTCLEQWTLLSREDQATLNNPSLPNSLICIDYIFAWKGGAPVQVLKAEVCKEVQCGTIEEASDHFPIYVDVKVGNSSFPLMEETPGLGEFEIVPQEW